MFLRTTASVIALGCSSCASVQTTIDERVVSRGPVVEETTSRLPRSDLFQVNVAACGDMLNVSVSILRACDRSERRAVVVDRAEKRTAPGVKYEAAAAVLLLGGGILLASRTRGGCADSNPPQCSGSDALFLTGFAMSYVGAGVGVATLVDGLRARDTSERVHTSETVERVQWCGEVPASGHRVVVATGPGNRIARELDFSGTADFTLPGIATGPSKVDVFIDDNPSVAVLVRKGCL